MIDTITAYDIQEVLERKFPPPAYLTIFEVRSRSGFAYRGRLRSADAVIFSMWESKGLTVSGCEIKVSRQDLKKELETPEKSAAIKKYCDYWWLCVPSSMKIDDFDMPKDWGIMTFDKHKSYIKKRAPKLQAEPFTRSFMFSCMRSVSRVLVDRVMTYCREIR